MKYSIRIFLFITFAGCSSKTNNFSETEIELFRKNAFDQEAFAQLKVEIKTDFKQLETSDPGYTMEDGIKHKTGVETATGISFTLPEEQSESILEKYIPSLKQHGYLLFVAGQGYESPATLAVIKSNDQFDILLLQQTDGINYDLENKDIMEKLKSWDERFGIQILGADYDWVDITFKKPIDSIPEFAKEVYEFCPDAVDQGVGSIEALEKIIRDENRLFLWWD